MDAISIKPSPKWTGGGLPPITHKSGGPGTASPTRVSYRYFPLRDLVREAYSVQPYQIVGPSWLVDVRYLETDTFDIDAEVPPGTNRQEYQAMLRNALADRFALQAHKEKRQMPGFSLVSMKNRRPALTPSPEITQPNASDFARLGSLGSDGFLATPPGYSGFFIRALPDRMRAKFLRQTMAQFADWLAGAPVKRAVTDQTGLRGVYDFVLEYEREGAVAIQADGTVSSGGSAAPTIFAAVQSQLGLKLAATTASTEVLVIDHADRRPSTN